MSAREEKLRKRGLKLAREAMAAQKAAGILPQASHVTRELQQEADRLKAEAESLKDQARREDLSIWKQEKVKSTKKGGRSYHYWTATWREKSLTRNVHLGSCAKMNAEEALQEARQEKAISLDIKP